MLLYMVNGDLASVPFVISLMVVAFRGDAIESME